MDLAFTNHPFQSFDSTPKTLGSLAPSSIKNKSTTYSVLLPVHNTTTLLSLTPLQVTSLFRILHFLGNVGLGSSSSSISASYNTLALVRQLWLDPYIPTYTRRVLTGGRGETKKYWNKVSKVLRPRLAKAPLNQLQKLQLYRQGVHKFVTPSWSPIFNTHPTAVAGVQEHRMLGSVYDPKSKYNFFNYFKDPLYGVDRLFRSWRRRKSKRLIRGVPHIINQMRRSREQKALTKLSKHLRKATFTHNVLVKHQSDLEKQTQFKARGKLQAKFRYRKAKMEQELPFNKRYLFLKFTHNPILAQKKSQSFIKIYCGLVRKAAVSPYYPAGRSPRSFYTLKQVKANLRLTPLNSQKGLKLIPALHSSIWSSLKGSKVTRFTKSLTRFIIPSVGYKINNLNSKHLNFFLEKRTLKTPELEKVLAKNKGIRRKRFSRRKATRNLLKFIGSNKRRIRLWGRRIVSTARKWRKAFKASNDLPKPTKLSYRRTKKVRQRNTFYKVRLKKKFYKFVKDSAVNTFEKRLLSEVRSPNSAICTPQYSLLGHKLGAIVVRNFPDTPELEPKMFSIPKYSIFLKLLKVITINLISSYFRSPVNWEFKKNIANLQSRFEEQTLSSLVTVFGEEFAGLVSKSIVTIVRHSSYLLLRDLPFARQYLLSSRFRFVFSQLLARRQSTRTRLNLWDVKSTSRSFKQTLKRVRLKKRVFAQTASAKRSRRSFAYLIRRASLIAPATKWRTSFLNKFRALKFTNRVKYSRNRLKSISRLRLLPRSIRARRIFSKFYQLSSKIRTPIRTTPSKLTNKRPAWFLRARKLRLSFATRQANLQGSTPSLTFDAGLRRLSAVKTKRRRHMIRMLTLTKRRNVDKKHPYLLGLWTLYVQPEACRNLINPTTFTKVDFSPIRLTTSRKPLLYFLAMFTNRLKTYLEFDCADPWRWGYAPPLSRLPLKGANYPRQVFKYFRPSTSRYFHLSSFFIPQFLHIFRLFYIVRKRIFTTYSYQSPFDFLNFKRLKKVVFRRLLAQKLRLNIYNQRFKRDSLRGFNLTRDYGHDYSWFSAYRNSFNWDVRLNPSTPLPRISDRWYMHNILRQPYYSTANRVQSDRRFFIKKTRFKPGYQTMWRRERVIIKEALNFTHRYHYRLTPNLQLLYLSTRWVEKHYGRSGQGNYSKLQLDHGLIFTHFAFDQWSADWLLDNNLVYLNGHCSNHGKTALYMNDFIQMIINTRFYFVHAWLRTLAHLRFNKWVRRYYKTFRIKRQMFKDYAVRTMPDKIFNLQVGLYDVPKRFEVDYFTLSAFVITEGRYFERDYPSTANQHDQHRLLILNMYNWKYLT